MTIGSGIINSQLMVAFSSGFNNFYNLSAVVYISQTQKFIPMNHSIENKQDLLAELFHLADVNNSQASYNAVLKIKRWKFIMKIPGISKKIREEANVSLEKTFFNYVTSTYVLIEEGYFFSPSEN